MLRSLAGAGAKCTIVYEKQMHRCSKSIKHSLRMQEAVQVTARTLHGKYIWTKVYWSRSAPSTEKKRSKLIMAEQACYLFNLDVSKCKV